MEVSSGLGSGPEDICAGLLETETYSLLNIPPCLLRVTTTLPPLNETLNETMANSTESPGGARRKRLVRRVEMVRKKRTLMTVCDESFVFGIKFHEADAWHFKLNGTLCPCGSARPELHNNPYTPGTFSPTAYYPGDIYDYYAVTLDPWDEALESDRWVAVQCMLV